MFRTPLIAAILALIPVAAASTDFSTDGIRFHQGYAAPFNIVGILMHCPHRVAPFGC